MEPKEIYSSPELDLIKFEADTDVTPSGLDSLEGESIIFTQYQQP